MSTERTQQQESSYLAGTCLEKYAVFAVNVCQQELSNISKFSMFLIFVA